MKKASLRESDTEVAVELLLIVRNSIDCDDGVFQNHSVSHLLQLVR